MWIGETNEVEILEDSSYYLEVSVVDREMGGRTRQCLLAPFVVVSMDCGGMISLRSNSIKTDGK